MKLKKSFVLLLLVPFALFFTSCENEIPEEFVIEINPYSSEAYGLDDVDYFTLALYKLPEAHEESNDDNGLVQTEDEIPPVFHDRLNKGDVLRLGNLEPGLYYLNGSAWKYGEDRNDAIEIGYVDGKSDKMETITTYGSRPGEVFYHDFIVIDEFSPTVVKLVVFFPGA
ncbi:MAG: hypothetical protein J5857_02935 [Treponema sp.]|nr:hypothetical protein [Treponema sp.]